MQLRRSFLLFIFIAALMSAVPDAFADANTFNTLFFKPATGKNAYLMLHSTDTVHQWQFQVAEYFSYGYRPLEIYQGGRIQGVTDHTLVSDFIGAIGFLEWLQLGFDFPVAVINEFRSPNDAATVPMQNKMGFSDLRFEIKARVLDPCVYPVGLAFVPFMSVPIGKDSVFLGDPGIAGGVRAVVDGKVMNNLMLTLNLGFQAGKSVLIRNVHYQNRMLLGAGISAKLKHGMSIFGEINGDYAFSEFFSSKEMNPTEAMIGVKWDIKDTGVTLSAAGGNCLICGVKGAYARAVIGASYRYNPKKYREMDVAAAKPCTKRFTKGLTAEEIYELKMKCPPNPADFKAGVHDDACPKFYELSEIADLLMRCPAKAEDFVAGVHDEACQKVFTLGDKYTDDEIMSIYTLMASELGLRCPADPNEFNPMLHDQACPKFYDLKTISELSTMCPDNMDEYRPGVDSGACPTYYTLRDKYPEEQWALVDLLSRTDTDKDGINDYLDQCPHDPEDIEGFADSDGCPDGGIAAISNGEIQTFKPVYFDFGRSELKYDPQQALDQVIAIINQTPWVRRVLVGGHADSRGTDTANEKIAAKRADVVIQYMNTHGVRSSVLLTPVGYGARKPIALGTSEDDYAKNRRVVFTIATEGFMPRQVYPKQPAKPKQVTTPKEELPAIPDQEGPAPKRWE
jgi:hypothetical protein